MNHSGNKYKTRWNREHVLSGIYSGPITPLARRDDPSFSNLIGHCSPCVKIRSIVIDLSGILDYLRSVLVDGAAYYLIV